MNQRPSGGGRAGDPQERRQETPGRRPALMNIEQHLRPSHAGLWLDKYMRGYPPRGQRIEGDTPGQVLIRATTEITVPAEYRTFFEAWQQTLRNADAVCRRAEVLGRLAVGLGAEGVLETSITLHHTYGVPYIPGSALKGLAAAYARQWLDWGDRDPAYVTLFGGIKDDPETTRETQQAGYITFFDALYCPPARDARGPLRADVMTVHHPDYYQGTAAPADWDSPNPVPFLTAVGSYLVALHGPTDWRNVAFALLEHALAEVGVGAKTAAGYGRLALGPEEERPPAPTLPGPPGAAAAGPAGNRPARPLPRVGQELRGQVTVVDANEVRVTLEGYDAERVLGVIPSTALGGRQYAPRTQAAVVVTGIRQTADGRTVIDLQPRPRRGEA